MADGGKNETYYDILNLPKNCSEKDIRNAFINLSKKVNLQLLFKFKFQKTMENKATLVLV